MAGQSPAWFTPERLLFLFCCMSLLVYLDRGVISSNGVNGARDAAGVPGYGIQGDFALSLFEDGVLPAAFMVGLLGASLVFAQASHTVNGFRLIGIGLAVWTVAVAGSGASMGFWSLVFCRMLVGVGEASFVSLASPFIDDNAPAASKSRWLACFYLCIPVGYALGYVLGGLLGGSLGWRSAFWLEALLMAPFALFCLLAPPIDMRGPMAVDEDVSKHEEATADGGKPARTPVQVLAADLAALWRHPVYTVTILGSSVYTGVLGAYAYMGPKAGRDVFVLKPETADLTFGVITVLTGILGTVGGGVVLDRIGSSVPNALLLCAAAVGAGGLFCALSFAAARSLASFAPLFALGELGLFAIQAPMNAVLLWSVPPGVRPLAMSLSVVATHLLGDVPSPPLLGLLQGRLGNWRVSMTLLSAVLLGSVLLYLSAVRLACTAPDYRPAAGSSAAEADAAAEAGVPDDEAPSASLLAADGSSSAGEHA